MVSLLEQLMAYGPNTVVMVIALIILLIPTIVKSWRDLWNTLGYTPNKKIHENAQEAKIQELEERIEQYQKHFDDQQEVRHNESIHIRDSWMKNQEQQGEIIAQILDVIKELREEQLDEKINRRRWRILDFADNLANGNSASLEQFNNIIETHTEYEKILRENNLTNGLVTASFGFIQEKYQELLHGHKEEE